MQRTDESNRVIGLHLVFFGVQQLPVCVIDKYDDARPDSASLYEHLLLLSEVILSEVLDYVL